MPGIKPADVQELVEVGADTVILTRGQHGRLGVTPNVRGLRGISAPETAGTTSTTAQPPRIPSRGFNPCRVGPAPGTSPVTVASGGFRAPGARTQPAG